MLLKCEKSISTFFRPLWVCVKVRSPGEKKQFPRNDQHQWAAHPQIISKNSKNWPGKLQKTTGWWLGHPSEKYESQLGWLFPIYRKMPKMATKPPTRYLYMNVSWNLSYLQNFTTAFPQPITWMKIQVPPWLGHPPPMWVLSSRGVPLYCWVHRDWTEA